MRLLGLPEADDDLILKLSWGLVGPEDPVRRLADHPHGRICRAGLGFQAYFDPVADDRRTCPRHDLTSVIANAEVQAEAMPDYERFSYYAMFATGGHDTIAFCLSGGMHALIEHPDQLAMLRADPSLIDAAIEEMLRWTTPGRHIVRTATRTSNSVAKPSGQAKRWRCFSIPPIVTRLFSRTQTGSGSTAAPIPILPLDWVNITASGRIWHGVKCGRC